MAVAFDTKAPGSSGGANISQAITIGSNSNRALYLFTFSNAGSAPSSISGGGGGAWTLVKSVAGGAPNNQFLDIYRSLNPNTGAQTITATVTSSDHYWELVSLYNVNQTTPEEGTGDSTGASSGSATLTMTSSTNNMAVDVIGVHQSSGSNTVTGSGFGTAMDTLNLGNNDTAGFSRAAGTGSMTSTWTANGNVDEWHIVGVSVAAAAVTTNSSSTLTMMGIGH